MKGSAFSFIQGTLRSLVSLSTYALHLQTTAYLMGAPEEVTELYEKK
jgi:hypothetical protein